MKRMQANRRAATRSATVVFPVTLVVFTQALVESKSRSSSVHCEPTSRVGCQPRSFATLRTGNRLPTFEAVPCRKANSGEPFLTRGRGRLDGVVQYRQSRKPERK